MTTKHTPGPWRVCDDGINVYAPETDTAITNTEHICAPDHDEAIANATLIAAAPDMLEALEAEEHAAQLEEEYGMFCRTWTKNERAEKWRDVEAQRKHASKLRSAAISKAKGQAE